MVAILEDPATCPHGNPIPGSGRAPDDRPLRSLTALDVGEQAVVVRIEEELQADHEKLVQLEAAGVLPGTTVTVTISSHDVIEVATGSGSVSFTPAEAEALRVASDPG